MKSLMMMKMMTKIQVGEVAVLGEEEGRGRKRQNATKTTARLTWQKHSSRKFKTYCSSE